MIERCERIEFSDKLIEPLFYLVNLFAVRLNDVIGNSTNAGISNVAHSLV